MKQNIFLPVFIILVFSANYSNIFAAGIKLINETPYFITIAIKGEGLVFASELPRVAILEPGATYVFDAGMGTIQEITAFMCGVISQFVFDTQGTSGIQTVSLKTVSDFLVLSPEQPTKKTKEAPPPVILKGAITKQTRLKCPCMTNPN
jgi:hypothetical protein